jgi:type I restriction enzyme, S subunit
MEEHQVQHTGVARFQYTKFAETEQIPLPAPDEQRAIAHILGTLDDKIELNRRMNETLEAMARALFKSWFVGFDPVRAKAEGRDPGLPQPLADLFPDSFEDSELGDIPTGWRAGRLDDVLAELVSGARPKGGAVEEGVPSIGAENVIGLGRYDFSKEKYVPQEFFERLKLNGAAVRAGDVLLYKDGAQIGRKTYFDCDFPHAECAINEHVFILRPRRSEEQRFLFFWLDQASMTQEIVSLNSNSAQPGINQSGVRGLPVLLPKDEVVDAFDQLAVRLTTRLFANCKESRTLAALRDTLLPKLISGEVLVRSLKKITPSDGQREVDSDARMQP